ncbi:WecB/TagA/CpsF family glycosyltransferase [Spirochaetia bacterium 38H-sp]|uniref:WecB/TagA/CpsF family glycosyltransferase n=1 Tax=Rarispira pelagica TaxID=3141764 RepID=A0ABU9U999_9SPIR
MAKDIWNYKTRIKLLGIPVDDIEEENIEKCFENFILDKKINHIIFIKLKHCFKARRSKKYRKVLESADLILPLDRAIVWGIKRLKQKPPVRYMPFDFIIKLLHFTEKKKGSLYLLGESPKDILKIENNIKTTFPNLRIVGKHHGKVPASSMEKLLTAIKKASPDVLIIGSGIKKPEYWILENKEYLPPSIVISSPETMKIFSGKKKDYRKNFYAKKPPLMNIIVNPFKILKIFYYLYFALFVLFYRLLGKQ